MNNTLVSFLCKSENSYTNNLSLFLQQYGYDSSIIVDDKNRYNIPDEATYCGLTKVCEDRPSSWEYSIYNISSHKLYHIYDYFFFIEDDVFSKQNNTFVNLISIWNKHNYDFIAKKIRPKYQEEDWIWWKDTNNWNNFDNPYKSFNTICRVSSRLIKKIISYQKIYQKFNFHEILFISLCIENNYSFMDYEDNQDLKKYIDINRIIPELSDIQIIHDDKLYHPYKKLLNE
jgi:hypothetical protein